MLEHKPLRADATFWKFHSMTARFCKINSTFRRLPPRFDLPIVLIHVLARVPSEGPGERVKEGVIAVAWQVELHLMIDGVPAGRVHALEVLGERLRSPRRGPKLVGVVMDRPVRPVHSGIRVRRE